MIKVDINASRKYSVHIGENILSDIGESLKKVLPLCKILIVTDENVSPLYLKAVHESLTKSGYKTYSAILNAGESSKSIEVFSYITQMCACINMSRKDCLVALGGGVVGDVVGFSASCYMRGINYVQVPTTLLSAIDSSVGGKTAVNTDDGKNLIGSFYQPIGVFYDINTFKTLPDEQVMCGLGEAIKYAVLNGGEIYEILNSGLNESNLTRLVELCVKAKAEIVEKDERESGIRKYLNLGHTVAHSLEKLFEYRLNHGIAVAKGLYAIANAQLKNGQISKDCFEKIERLLKKYGFDLTLNRSVDLIIEVMSVDKKSRDNGVELVLIKDIGNVYTKFMTFEEIKEFLK